MKIVKWLSIILVVGLIIAAVVAPIGPAPGIFASGTASDVPASWGDTSSTLEIELQVGAGPIGRTVTIWAVQVDGEMYVTGDKNSGWVRGVGDGGPVRMNLNGKLYSLTATAVDEPEAMKALTAWHAKYVKYYPDMMKQFPSPEEGARSAKVFRLAA